jgi:hypothetical protein
VRNVFLLPPSPRQIRLVTILPSTPIDESRLASVDLARIRANNFCQEKKRNILKALKGVCSTVCVCSEREIIISCANGPQVGARQL